MLYTCLLTVQFYMIIPGLSTQFFYNINIQLTLLLFFKVTKTLLIEKEVNSQK